ncbi:hypothetical protein SSX86_015293 [Deinandra increscens subsp. villosa]|uniref:Osmotin-like protein n=1 Tax=Deinandra increscens subsp. villosa TaxID=3103831 RepID=A0AAP0CZK3_9ASTR
MISSSLLFLSSATLLLLLPLTSASMILTVVNNCRFPIWPAIQPNSGHPVLERGGFALNPLSHRSFPAPASHWSGRIWARTACAHKNGRFTCATGDCGGRLECNGLGGATPATLAQLSLHHTPTDQSSYAVSLVDGFNVPMTVTPHEGKGVCPVVGCKADLLATCPWSLQMHADGRVVGCKSGCEAFNTDEFCCRGRFNNAQTCKGSKWSDFFKHACPATFAYAHDSPSLMHECMAPRELKVIFCH